VGPLAAHGETLAVAQAAVAAQIHQALDIHANFTAKVAFDDVIAVNRLADLQDFRVRQLIDAAISRNADPAADLLRKLGPDPMDVLKRNEDALLRRDIHTSYTSHVGLLEASSSAAQSSVTQQFIYLFFNEKTRIGLIRAKIAARSRPSVSSS
jgi:hypothetical protein